MATKTRRKTTKEPSKVIEPEKKYKLTVYLQGKEFICNTDNIAESLLALKPEKITNKVKIVVEEGNKKVERDLFVFPARRLFNIPLATQFFAKNIVLRLK